MAATRTRTRIRRTTPRPRRSRRLPRLGALGWTITILSALGIVKTWPIWTAVVVALAAAGLIVRAIRPARLGRLWTVLDRIYTRRRRALPTGPVTLRAFLAMDPTRFEHAITELAARHPDVATAEHSGRTADRGMDALATLHDGTRILIQCKHYTPGHNVGGDTLREIVGSVLAHGCQHGTIVTTSGFTTEAYATNATLGPHALTLIDGPALEQWANGRHLPWQ